MTTNVSQDNEPVLTVATASRLRSKGLLISLTIINGILQIIAPSPDMAADTAGGSRALGRMVGSTLSPWIISAVIALVLFYIYRYLQKPKLFQPLWLTCAFWVLILCIISVLPRLAPA